MRKMDGETDIRGTPQQLKCRAFDLPPIRWLGGGEDITLLTLGFAAELKS